MLVLAGALGFWPSAAQAQDAAPAKAGLVVDFGGGSVYTACVDLGPDGQATGEEVLRASGFDVLIEYSPMGGAVCRIDSRGCDFPAQPCWCECMSSPCVYWAYHHLVNGQWVYSTQGASTYVVRAGDVEGWAWGAGTVAQGAQPALRTYGEICAPPTATPSPSPTSTPLPTDTPTATPWPTPTWTATPTWTPVATTAPVVLLPTVEATPTPTTTPTSSATPTAIARAVAVDASITTVPPDKPLSGEQAMPAANASRRTFLPLLARSAAEAAPAALIAAPTAMLTPEPTPTPAALAIAMAQPAVLADGRLPVSDRYAIAREYPRTVPLAVDPAAVTRASGDPVFVAALALVVAMGLASVRVARAGVWRAWLDAVKRIAVRPPQPASPRRAAPTHGSQWPGALIYALSMGLGLLALLYPFLSVAMAAMATSDARVADAPLLLMVLVGLCFLALLSEVQERAVSAKIIALLGVLVAINSVLRFVEVAIPGPGGFTPVFFLIVLTGYVYGGRFGFLLGALTMLVSAVITGGVGPWLPGQMFTAGWMGLTAPLARPLVRMAGGAVGSRRELLTLAAFAGLWGLVYGVVINLWFWPFMAGPANQYYQAGLGVGDILRRYALFYVATSLVWDLMAVVGNVTLVVAFGGPTLRALRRFQQRFEFSYRPWATQIEV